MNKIIFGALVLLIFAVAIALEKYYESKETVYYAQCIDSLGVNLESLQLHMSISFMSKKIEGFWYSNQSNGQLTGEIVSDEFKVVLYDNGEKWYLTAEGTYNKGYFLGTWRNKHNNGSFQAYY